ncbi:GntR family transcriptional regulator [Amycolatopsis nigrescens]|uniref:GntR family transcriptional regulator n=1 Tax=Amycolatopsis nigrescens TaxID=381445 RepID=UPI0003750BDC|nr:GntR family transcriptional regulator [Amycolatopsis nigrescens]
MTASFAAAPTPPELPETRRPADVPAKDFVYDYVKRLVVDLTLPPGHIVTEMDIAKVTGVSRTPVREAFLRLDAERLLQLLPRRGALVTTVTARQIRELHTTRLVLELHAVREIITQEIDISADLQKLIDEQQALMDAGSGYPAVVACDREFHNTIIRAVGNTELAHLYGSMGDRQQRTGVVAFSVQPGRAEMALGHHRQIAEALGRFDGATAEAAMREHLDRHSWDLERYLP